jgi:hypothetical protein
VPVDASFADTMVAFWVDLESYSWVGRFGSVAARTLAWSNWR